jgi:MFS family permease
MMIFVGSLIGKEIAPEPSMATLPIAVMIVGTALSAIPVSLSMQAFGRKAVFVGGALLSAAAAALAALALSRGSFLGFCLSSLMVGTSLAVVQQYRFAAMESVVIGRAPKAASSVLLGGLVAAILGPELAFRGKALLPGGYIGSFLLLALISVAAALLLLLFRNQKVSPRPRDEGPARHWLQIARQPQFVFAVTAAAVGYALMSFVMTATPIQMHVMNGHNLAETKTVIQGHILAMYLPSLFSGWLICRFGVSRVVVAGVVIFAISLLAALSGVSAGHYGFSLIMLGIGWNFLFVGGTTLLPSTYRDSERFKVLAANEFIVFGTQAIAALSSGWLLHQLGWHSMLWLCAPVLLLPLFTLLWWWRGQCFVRKLESL